MEATTFLTIIPPPQDIFGGEWIRIQGRFLFGRSDDPTANQNVGDVGGEYVHALTKEEMPTHDHKGFYWAEHVHGYEMDLNTGTIGYHIQWNGQGGSTTGGGGAGDPGKNMRTANAGASQAHNNMPPYICTNIWKRTA